MFTAIYAAAFLGEAITRATLGALGLTSVGVVLVMLGTAPAGSLTLGPLAAGRRAVRDAVGRGGRDDPRGAQDRRLVGDLRRVLPGRRRDLAVPRWPAGSPPRPVEWLLLAAVGVTSVVGQLLMTHALRYVRAAVGGIIAQLTPVTSLALGWVLFGDRIGGLALAGAALTLAGVSVGAYLAAGREADPVED